MRSPCASINWRLISPRRCVSINVLLVVELPDLILAFILKTRILRILHLDAEFVELVGEQDVAEVVAS
jgi:hypothetical protein